MDRLLANKGLLNQIDQVRQNVSHKASELVVNAMGFLGVPYKRGGNSAETGFDCSGFVVSVYRQSIGLLLPRKAEQQAAATQQIDKNELQPGDLVFFNTMRRAFSHVGIYVGNGKFIHAPKPGAEVRVESMGGSYWQNRFDGARRVAGGQSSAQPVQAVLAATPSTPTFTVFGGDNAPMR
jgi:cell wall-associated NlpC family hydrolase